MTKGVIKHNNREANFEHNKQIDPTRTHLNETFVKEDLGEVYSELFDESVKKFNEKQKEKSRIIDDYMSKIEKSGNGEHLFREIIVQIGDHQDTPNGSKTASMAISALKAYETSFQERNANLRVFNSVLHVDESTPHLHISFVPFSTGNKRGMETKNSFTGALKEQGYSKESQKEWFKDEREILSKIAKEYNLETKTIGIQRKNYDLPEYKEAMSHLEAVREQKSELEYSVKGLDKKIREMNVKAIETEEEIHDLKTTKWVLEDSNQLKQKELDIIKKSLGKIQAVKDHKPIQEVKKGMFKDSVEYDWKASYYDLKTQFKVNLLEISEIEKKDAIIESLTKMVGEYRERERPRHLKEHFIHKFHHNNLEREKVALEQENEQLKEKNASLTKRVKDLSKRNIELERENRKIISKVIMAYDWIEDKKDMSKLANATYQILEKTGLGDVVRQERERQVQQEIERRELAEMIKLEKEREQKEKEELEKQKYRQYTYSRGGFSM